MLALKMEERGAVRKKVGPLSQQMEMARKQSSLEPALQANALILAQLDLIQIPDLWNRKIINLCCFKILPLWKFITVQ